jgi:prevent-host-death family protein
MKTVSIREARATLADLLERAQKEPILITRHGKPVVLVTGVDGVDLGSVILEGSQDFWKELERRRKSTAPRKTHEQLMAKYGLDRRKTAKKAKAAKAAKAA